MAEAVQTQLENQVPELHDLIAAGIFSRSEVREIVKRRKSFEYALRRRAPLKRDFLEYIQYELNVDALRRQRKVQRRIQRKHSKPSEFAIKRRVHFIFKRALQKFKGDITLWLQYFTFCENSGANKALGRAFGEALQYNPRVPGFWIKAATWEWTGNSNIAAARVMMQRGIRMNPANAELWREYLRLELLYLEKVALRREVLGLPAFESSEAEKEAVLSMDEDAKRKRRLGVDDTDEAVPNSGDEEESDDDDEDGMSDEDEDIEGDDTSNAAESRVISAAVNVDLSLISDESTKSGVDRFLRGDVAIAVASAAVAAIPGDCDFVFNLIAIFRLFRNTLAGRDMLYAALGDGPDAVAARCRRPAEDSTVKSDTATVMAQFNAVVNNFENALNTSATSSLWEHYAMFVDSADVPGGKTKLLEICAAAEKASMATDELYSMWLTATLNSSEANDAAAVKIAERAISSSAPSTKMLLSWLTLVLQRQPTDFAAEKSFERVICLASSSEGRAAVWRAWIGHSIMHFSTETTEQMFARYISALETDVVGATSSLADAAKVEYIEWASATGGVSAFRKAYTEMIDGGLVAAGWPVYRRAVEFERRQPEPRIKRLRALLEKASQAFGNSLAEVWLEYAEAELTCGDHVKAAGIHWRGVKTLQDPAYFIAEYSTRFAGVKV